MEDTMDDNVQKGAASEGAVSKEGAVSENGTVSPETVESQAKPLTVEQINQMIKSAMAEQERQSGKLAQSLNDQIRHLKGQLAESRQKAEAAGGTLETIRGRVKETDPELVKEMELAELRARAQQYEKSESERTQKEQQAEFDRTFHSQLGDLLEGFDIDPADSRIDWGSDAKDYLEKQGRILASVKKIRAEQAKSDKEQRAKEFDDFKAKLRKELGLDSVDTANVTGQGDDDAFVKAYSEGKSDDHARFIKIMQKLK